MSSLINESTNKRKGLGRGLGSLLGDVEARSSSSSQSELPKVSPSKNEGKVALPTPSVATQVVPSPSDPENRIWKVSIDKLASGHYQPRQQFNKESLQELAQSIRENGILQPIIARRTESGKLEIVAGERRWRAAQLAGLHEVPVILRNFQDKEALELAIIENVQREDLNPIEEAEGYARLISEFKLSQQQVAEKVGKDRATVANAIRLLMLPPELKEMVTSGSLSVGHAKVLLSVQDTKQQVELAKRSIVEKMPVRKLEKIIQEFAKNKTEALSVPALESNVTLRLISGLSEELQKILGTKVAIDYSNSKGKISIHFYSDDELSNLVEKLKEAWQ